MPKDRLKILEDIHTGKMNRSSGYFEVPTLAFVQGIDVKLPVLPEADFFVLNNGKPEIVRRAGEPYSPLALNQFSSIWFRDQDYPIVRAHVEKHLLMGSQAKDVPPEVKIETMRRSAMVVVDDLFQNPSPENVDRSIKVVGSFVYLLMKDPKAYMLLSKLSSHDPYTLQHSVGTSVNSIILAKKIGIKDEKELLEVGLGGLLHDIGKVKVKKEIINKQGPLDELEWEEMRQHSSEGFEIVKDNPTLSDRTKRAILEHHEDKNGTGYPHRLRSDDLDIFSRIVCICDVFNALTTDRTYSKARSPYDAFDLMRSKLMHKIDDELFRQLVMIYAGKLGAPATAIKAVPSEKDDENTPQDESA